MISPLLKERVSYVASVLILLAITLGCTAALVYMGLRFIMRFTG